MQLEIWFHSDLTGGQNGTVIVDQRDDDRSNRLGRIAGCADRRDLAVAPVDRDLGLVDAANKTIDRLAVHNCCRTSDFWHRWLGERSRHSQSDRAADSTHQADGEISRWSQTPHFGAADRFSCHGENANTALRRAPRRGHRSAVRTELVGSGAVARHHVGVNPTLVIIAAGLGSRFGGVKQLARVGSNNEAILDFSINDGLTAGFESVVLVIRGEIEADVRTHMAEQHPGLEAIYVRQEDLGPARDKPWGTLHAVLSAADVVDKPFAVINADDYYGPTSFRLAVEELETIEAGVGANIAFELGKTVPPRGAVSRAQCQVADGQLTAIVETHGCERVESGELVVAGHVVPEETLVSLNMWCFHHSVMDDFAERWASFYEANSEDSKSECQLPTVVGELMDSNRLRIRVTSSPDQWIGITNPEDLAVAQAKLAERGE